MPQVAEVASTANASEDADAQLVKLAWQKNCQTCHGPTGKGDGPQGPMLKAPDLTRPDWLATVSDDEIKTTIRNGRGAMPGFGSLPNGVVDGLVARLRAGGKAH